MNHTPVRASGRDLERFLAASPQDQGESPFGWSSPSPLPCSGIYGDPTTWHEVPPELTAETVAELTACGWTGARATEHSIVVPLDDRATGLPDQAARGDHLYVMWGWPRPEWAWGTAHPHAPAGGPLAPLLAPPDDPCQVAAQIVRVLTTGRALP
ncbi:hypothetical protein [Streptomyces cinereoruber]|uniref:hypothetical protein n=1 Tax=Streptomyces cinereoruber TaxID=67260 RepID=UPI00363C944D